MEWVKIAWEALRDRFQQEPDTLPSDTVLLTLFLLALAFAFTPAVWRWSSYFITVVHEGGHALAALMVGSRLHGITIRWDRSGETMTMGRRFTPFRIWTTWWGYPFPAFLGAFYVWGAQNGWQGPAVTLTLLMAVIMFLSIRSLMAFLSIGLSVVGLGLAWWYLPPSLMGSFLYFLGWFLLFGGLRGLTNLVKHHLDGTTENSDATALQQMTFIIPAVVWLASFWVAQIACLYFAVDAVFLS